jgi:hypothetical protein
MSRAIAFACTVGIATVGFNFEPALAAEPQPGLWEIHKTYDSGGTSKKRPVKTWCMSAERAAHFSQLPSREVTVGPGVCKSFELSKTDNGTTWTTQCPSLPFRMAASYVGDTPQHYVWTFRREIIVAGQRLATSTVTIEGKRIGECPK